jgi:hypothetical protein
LVIKETKAVNAGGQAKTGLTVCSPERSKNYTAGALSGQFFFPSSTRLKFGIKPNER